jgi:hypothetical protein
LKIALSDTSGNTNFVNHWVNFHATQIKLGRFSSFPDETWWDDILSRALSAKIALHDSSGKLQNSRLIEWLLYGASTQ